MLSEPIITVRGVAKAIFPLDEPLGMATSGFSQAFSKQMVWLSGLLPYEHCQQVLARVGER
jgi:hypothetical protein